MKQVLQLCSGGIDSITCAALLQQQDYKVSLLHVDYGQVTAPAEKKSLDMCAMQMRIADVVYLNMPGIGLWGQGSLVGDAIGGGAESEYFPNRNLFLIGTAAVVAGKRNIDHISIGIIEAENADYADCSIQFINSISSTLRCLSPSINLIAPVGSMSKKETVALASTLNVPLSYTFSCNRRGDRHCWECNGCLDRILSFNQYAIPL